MRLLTVAIALVVVTAVQAAEPLSTEDLARVNREMKAAADAVSKKYGDEKKLSPAERRAMANEQMAAQKSVLDRNNLDAKEVARATAKNGKAVEAAVKALDAKEAEAAKKTPAAPASAPAAGATDADANEAAAMDQARGLGAGKK
ncbi:MAG: hypothetical protein Q8L48_20665 [Archangium sp.]|nr:hypothetical protein [Archangium sp.]